MKSIQSRLACVLISSLTIFTSISSFAQTTHSITASAKATATLASVCTISSQNVSFGQISLPISTQSASSNITIQCTKGSSYTVGLAYGGIYGTGVTANWILVGTNGKILALNTATDTVTTLTSVPSGYVLTHASADCYNSFGEPAAADMGPYNCAGYQSSGSQYIMSSYGYGKMIGAAKGDAIGYSIQVPNKPSEVWNTGNYTYTSTGTGASQTIPVVATIAPSQTANSYPIADTYFDTVTATIQY